jgi:hypothetical protein
MRSPARLAWLAFAVAAIGCTSHNSNNHSDLSPPCTAGTKECLDSATVRVCPSDSSGWVTEPCPLGSMCLNGACSAPNVSAAPCIPGLKVCSGNNSLTCSASGFGYQVTACPSGTTCLGQGFCVGSCPLGVGMRCLDNTTVLSCSDGFTLTPSPCPTGSYCVTDQTQNNRAVCAAGDCTPDFVNGCNSQCGIMGGPSPSPGATGYVSTCTNTNTSQGYRWIATQCSVGSCDPQGADCSLNGGAVNKRLQEGACVSQCKPGAVRCNGNATQTCDANGNWGPLMACNPGLVCGTATGSALCGDPVCVQGNAEPQGTCIDVSGVSELIPCANGTLAPSPAPCTTGLCVRDNTITGVSNPNIQPGKCAPQCSMGDSRCAGPGNSQVQGCTSNGLWSGTTTACSSGTCQGYTDVAGRSKTVCGVCSPGASSCADTSHVQVCDATGQQGPSTACTIGRCQNNACTADCIPGAFICVGAAAPSPLPGTPTAGTSAAATCTSNGINPGAGYPTFTGPGGDPCYTGTAVPSGVTCCSASPAPGVFGSCRTDQGGNAIGCVACVGTGTNEVGLVDTRCSDVNGNPGNTDVETCLANNSGWGTPAACTGGSHCHDPNPASFGGGITAYQVSCHNIGCGGSTCTETFWNNSTPSSSCVTAGMGGPVSCGNTIDCCADACFATSVAEPALCGG